jgi:hypothetical protein
MRLVHPLRSLSMGLGAAGLVLTVCAAVTAPAWACEKEKAASVATASLSKGSPSVQDPASGACLVSAHGSPSTCREGANATASFGSTKGSCAHSAKMTGKCPHAAPTRTTVASRKPAVRTKPAVKRVAGTTAALTTPGTAGLIAVIDPVTGRVVAPTAEQLRELTAASKTPGVGTSSARPDDIHFERLPNGTLVAQVPERLYSNAVARRDKNGKFVVDCKNPNAAPSTSAPAEPAPATWEEK